MALLLIAFAAMLLSGCGASLKSAASPSQSSSAQSAVSIKAKTHYLEYSSKDIDPNTLVEASDGSARIAATNRLDLSAVGAQDVTYEITSDGRTSSQKVGFIVRDTKAPAIQLSSSTSSAEQGTEPNLQDAVGSVADEVDGPLPFVESPPEASGKKAGLDVFYDQGWYTFEGQVNSSKPGTYPVKVTAADKHGNTASKELKVSITKPVIREAAPAPAPAPAATQQTYIANKNTKKFHHPECSSAKQIKQSNRLEFTTTRSEMINMGYDPCKRCNP